MELKAGNPQDRPGWFSSEYFILIITSLFSILGATGILTPEVAKQKIDTYIGLMPQITQLITLVGPVVGAIFYTKYRKDIKIAKIEESKVISTCAVPEAPVTSTPVINPEEIVNDFIAKGLIVVYGKSGNVAKMPEGFRIAIKK